MFNIDFFDRIFFRVNYSHIINDVFNFGINFSSEPQAFAIYENKESLEPTYINLQETRLNLWLGIISFHTGWREKFEK